MSTDNEFHPRNIPGMREYAERTEYLRATGFTHEAAARDKYHAEAMRNPEQVRQDHLKILTDAGVSPAVAQETVDYNIAVGRIPTGSTPIRVNFLGALREEIESLHPSREKSLALTKLDECEMWLARAPR